VQKLTDSHVRQIDELQKKKDQELLGQVACPEFLSSSVPWFLSFRTSPPSPSPWR
jgi:hypothetical protein